MKSKILLLAIIGSLFILNSCDDLLSVSFDADFETDFNIEVAETKTAGYSFFQSEILNIEDHEEVKKHIQRLKNLKLKRIEAIFSGLPAGAVIQQVNVKLVDIDQQITLTNIAENSSLSLPVDDTTLDLIAGYLFSHRRITIELSGLISDAPLTFRAKLKFLSSVKAGV